MQRDTEDQRLLHALSLSVIASDETGLVSFVNQAATELFQTSAEDLIGRRVGPADRDRRRGGLRR